MKPLWIFPLVLFAGMGLSIEAGLLGPLGKNIGHIWATLGIFVLGSILLTLGLIFSRHQLSFVFKQPKWQLIGGILGPIYVISLTVATPYIGVSLTMVGILLGQIATSLVLDHWGLLGSHKRSIDKYRIFSLISILAAIWFIQ